MNIDSFDKAIRQGTKTGDWSFLDFWVTEESSFAFKDGSIEGFEPIEDAVIDGFIALLNNPEFLNSEKSFGVLMFLESEWQLFSESHKQRLLPPLVAAYPRFKDSTSWFVISELLGKFYANEDALQALLCLKSMSDEAPRSLIPMGLERIVSGSSDFNLSQRAYAQLKQMLEDPSEQVRYEVELSMIRLANQGFTELG